MVYMQMTHTLSQSLGRRVNFGGICALPSIGVGAVVERIFSCLCLPKWEGIPNILVKLRRPWYLLTKFCFSAGCSYRSPKWAVELTLSLSHWANQVTFLRQHSHVGNMEARMLKAQDVVRIKGETECLCESMLIKSIVHKGAYFCVIFK